MYIACMYVNMYVYVRERERDSQSFDPTIVLKFHWGKEGLVHSVCDATVLGMAGNDLLILL